MNILMKFLKGITKKHFNHIDIIAAYWIGALFVSGEYLYAVLTFFGGVIVSALLTFLAESRD